MDRREALKKMAIGGATVVGATAVMTSTAFAYGEPYNINASLVLTIGGEGGYEYRNRKIGIRFRLDAKCRASSTNANDDARIESKTGTLNSVEVQVTPGGNQSTPNNLYFNYVSPTDPNWSNGYLPVNVTRLYDLTGSPDAGINFTIRKTTVPSSLTLSDYRDFNNGEKINIEFRFRLRCSPTKFSDRKYTGYIQFGGIGDPPSWTTNMNVVTW